MKLNLQLFSLAVAAVLSQNSFGASAPEVVSVDGGLWWDPTIRKYRLWYETDWAGQLRYAESADGLKWEMPDLGVVKGTNRALSWSVWPDYKAKNPYGSWKMLISALGDICTVDDDHLRARRGGRAGAPRVLARGLPGPEVHGPHEGRADLRRRLARRPCGQEAAHPVQAPLRDTLQLLDLALQARGVPRLRGGGRSRLSGAPRPVRSITQQMGKRDDFDIIVT